MEKKPSKFWQKFHAYLIRLVAAFSVVILTGAAFAVAPTGVATLKGNYYFQLFTSVGGVPAAEYGTATADGKGNLTFTSITKINTTGPVKVGTVWKYTVTGATATLGVGQGVNTLSGMLANYDAAGIVSTILLRNANNSPAMTGIAVLDGSIGIGATGATGPQGPIGLPGAKGATGAIGPQGNFGVQGATGATGAMGLQGPQGLQGPPGLNGSKGINGVNGAQGVVGPAGPQGQQGPQGEAGPVGPQGPQGFQGTTGATGSIGPQGIPGAPAIGAETVQYYTQAQPTPPPYGTQPPLPQPTPWIMGQINLAPGSYVINATVTFSGAEAEYTCAIVPTNGDPNNSSEQNPLVSGYEIGGSEPQTLNVQGVEQSSSSMTAYVACSGFGTSTSVFMTAIQVGVLQSQ